MFAGAHESFYAQVPSNQVLETLEPCELIVLSFEKLQEGISNTEITQAIETIKKIQLNITQEHSFKLWEK